MNNIQQIEELKSEANAYGLKKELINTAKEYYKFSMLRFKVGKQRESLTELDSYQVAFKVVIPKY